MYCNNACPLWVKSRHLQRKRRFPLYPQERTCAVQLGMSFLGQSGHYIFAWWDYLAASDPKGISIIKLVPMSETRCVNSAPNCFASALIKREPSRLLVSGSKSAGKPTPSSRTDI